MIVRHLTNFKTFLGHNETFSLPSKNPCASVSNDEASSEERDVEDEKNDITIAGQWGPSHWIKILFNDQRKYDYLISTVLLWLGW